MPSYSAYTQPPRSYGSKTDLMAEYDKHNRRIIPMTVALFKKWL
ncbi:hypothetical protein GCM10027064_15230 [Microbacterium petrolearium]